MQDPEFTRQPSELSQSALVSSWCRHMLRFLPRRRPARLRWAETEAADLASASGSSQAVACSSGGASLLQAVLRRSSAKVASPGRAKTVLPSRRCSRTESTRKIDLHRPRMRSAPGDLLSVMEMKAMPLPSYTALSCKCTSIRPHDRALLSASPCSSVPPGTAVLTEQLLL